MKKGQVLEGIVERVVFPNRGIVSVEGEEQKVIVKNAIEGQKIRFSINKKRKGKAEGRLLEVIEKSQLQTEEECAYFGKMAVGSGSTVQEQLKIKETQVKSVAPVLLNAGYELDEIFEVRQRVREVLLIAIKWSFLLEMKSRMARSVLECINAEVFMIL